MRFISMRETRDGLHLPDIQLLIDCLGNPASSKAWRVLREMYNFMDAILHENNSPCQWKSIDKGFPRK